jgi:hypothetical protein
VDHARAQGAQRFVILGDLVGYGAHPGEVVDQVMQLALQGAVVIRGIHDAMAVQPEASDQSLGASTALWTHQQLSLSQRDFLATHGLQMQRFVATVPIKVAMGAPCTVILVKQALPFESWA